MKIEKTTLEGRHVRLEPLSEHHKEGMRLAIKDGELWKLFVTLVPHPDNIDQFFAKAEAAFIANDGLTYATIDKKTNQVAGSTRFMKAVWPHQRLEIGFTFLGKSWQKTAINTEAKWLMLSHAFETLKLNRVEFLTDYLNHHSRAALLRLGAKEEGLLQQHMVMPDGRIRDSVLFSIVNHDWAGVKQHLAAKLELNV